VNGPEYGESRLWTEPARFFLNWLQNPLTVGAVAPSGRELARLMTAGLAPGARVVELGAGTGTLTQAILERGVHSSDLHIVEQNESFADLLHRRFPACTVVAGDAERLARHLQALRGSADFVISGLPLLLFSVSRKARVLQQALTVLARSGCIHQFTYGGRCSISRGLLARYGVRASLLGVAALNIPPAFVYRLKRADD
jgi:phosphatidylethanolamine/phosphatidyl-N-methylethanolamine N-methyltransferase